MSDSSPHPQDPLRRGSSRGPSGPGRPARPFFGWVLMLAVGMMLIVLLTNNLAEQRETITIDQFWALVESQQIKQLVIHDDSIEGRRRITEGSPRGQPVAFRLRYPPGAIDQEFIQRLQEKLPQAKIDYQPSQTMLFNVLITFVPWLLIFLFIYFVFIRQLRGAGGGAGVLGNFGRSRHRVSTKEHTNITFADVAGVDEAKEEVQEIIEFLKNPKRFQRLGGRIPRGVLLVGPPGCGKTLLAKAIAGEADVPFFSISGSDFVEMFVGVGASRVRDLFKQAKENAPCIIFLDEIDAVGRRRGTSFAGGGHDEREQTLNAILVEMDGFDSSDQVIVIAATNRVDVLDPALIRPGRFDRQVYVPLPDVKGRLDILRVHARKVKLGPDVDLHALARATPMFSGADLAAIINEAALIATMANKDAVEMSDLEEARDKVRFGRAKRSRAIDEKERRETAYHEAGHALVQSLLPAADPVHKVSIIPRGPYGGATFSLPEKDRQNLSRDFVLATMRVLCAGRIAEEEFCGTVTTGAAADIRQVTEFARHMVTEWGMDEQVGFVFLGSQDGDPSSPWSMLLPGGRGYSEETARLIDAEVKRLIDEAFADARRLILENREKVERIAEALLRYETLTGEEVRRLIEGETLDRPTLGDLLDRSGSPETALPEARPASSGDEGLSGLGGDVLPQPG